jgi:hypothetical protein
VTTSLVRWQLCSAGARIELTREEASYALSWADRIDGWTDSDSKPLFVYLTKPTGEVATGEIG